MNEKNPFGGLGYLLNKANNQTYFVFAGLSLIFGLFFGLNYLFPIFSDDFNYSFVNNISASERITSLCDIFASQYNHYFNWGGRSVVHTIAQALLLLPLLAAKLLNSGIFTLYIYIIYKIANNGKPANVKSLLIVAIFFWLTIQGFFTVTLWLTGSANYLWGMLIVLLFLYRYYNYYCTGKSSDGFAIAIVYFLFGILSGWTNENMFVAQVFFIVSVFFLYKKNNLTIPKWAIFGLIGVLIGGTMMLLAPGNFVRSEVVAEGLGFADKSFFYTLFYKLGKIFYRYAVYILPITILYFALLFFK